VHEKTSKARHLQTVAGVQSSAYWLSTFLWDSANYQIPLWITVALMFTYNVTILTTSEHDVFTGILLMGQRWNLVHRFVPLKDICFGRY
jgi:hypothetical protein